MKSYFICGLLLAGALYARAGERIEDNSFLVEEAYNQEAGVVQHIQAYQYLRQSRSWGYAFTQEWPVRGQDHQLSYTLPLSRPGAGQKAGIGDVLVNYRYQLARNERLAFAPRVSALVPSGDYRRGLGSGAAGVQANLPLSLVATDRLVAHWNAGLTYVPGAREPGGLRADTLGFNYSGSLIAVATPKLNLMLEAAWSRAELVGSSGRPEGQEALFLSPGIRGAIDFESGLQIVPGLAIPIGLGPSKDERGVFLYLSFEHPLLGR